MGGGWESPSEEPDLSPPEDRLVHPKMLLLRAASALLSSYRTHSRDA